MHINIITITHGNLFLNSCTKKKHALFFQAPVITLYHALVLHATASALFNFTATPGAIEKVADCA